MKINIIGSDSVLKIGESADENTKLVKESKQTDLWFHLHGTPSPHGILRFEEGDMSQKASILKAASLIKENSKMKGFKRVSVIYLPLKNVRTTRVPGRVILRAAPKIVRL